MRLTKKDSFFEKYIETCEAVMTKLANDIFSLKRELYEILERWKNAKENK